MSSNNNSNNNSNSTIVDIPAEVPYDDKKWTKKSQKLALSWLKRTIRTANNYSRQKRLYSRIHIGSSILIIIFNVLGGSLGFYNANPSESIVNPEMQTSFLIFIASINIVAAVLGGIMQFLSLPEKKENLHQSVLKLTKLCRDIEIVLSSHPKTRPNPLEFLTNISEKYLKYQQEGHFIEESLEDGSKCINFAELKKNTEYEGMEIDGKGEIKLGNKNIEMLKNEDRKVRGVTSQSFINMYPTSHIPENISTNLNNKKNP